jgi:NADPH-dependent curcumin reductase CurA
MSNRQFRLASRPTGLVGRENFELTEEDVPAPDDGQVLVKLEYISLDPAMRGWMNDARSYVPPVQIGEVMRALGAGTVQTSNHGSFKEGQHVVGVFGVQEYAVSDGQGVIAVDPNLVPLPTYLGALGMTGMTAYFGLLDVGDVKEGETVVVSGAAGAVGSVAGQIAKIKGCRVVGIAGGAEKCSWLTDDLGFDAAIDYKSEDVRAALKEHCPKGVDVYFDNVGGDILDIVLGRLACRARIVICGAISQYNREGGMKGPANYMSLLVNRARMEGFVVFDYADRYAEAGMQMAGWMAEGKLRSREEVVEGLENFPEALLKLFNGENIGKLVLQV